MGASEHTGRVAKVFLVLILLSKAGERVAESSARISSDRTLLALAPLGPLDEHISKSQDSEPRWPAVRLVVPDHVHLLLVVRAVTGQVSRFVADMTFPLIHGQRRSPALLCGVACLITVGAFGIPRVPRRWWSSRCCLLR